MLNKEVFEVMSDLQHFQDLLADRLELFLLLIDEKKTEITLPSRQPLLCHESSGDRRCQDCVAACMRFAEVGGSDPILKCHRDLYIAVIPTNIAYLDRMYLICGRTPLRPGLEEQLHLLQAIYSLPISLRGGRSAKLSCFSAGAELHNLTRQELLILSFLVDGLANKDIADKLNITVSTVKTHIIHILKKLAVKNRTEASIAAVKSGIIK